MEISLFIIQILWIIEYKLITVVAGRIFHLWILEADIDIEKLFLMAQTPGHPKFISQTAANATNNFMRIDQWRLFCRSF